MIKLNVGGQLFVTTRETLSGSKYFETLLSKNWQTSNDEIFIDRSPWIFKHVLNLLRDPKYEYPFKYASELEFFGIEVVIEPAPIEFLTKKEHKEAIDTLHKQQMINHEETMKEMDEYNKNIMNKLKKLKDTIKKMDGGTPYYAMKYMKQKEKKRNRNTGCWRADHLILTDKGFVLSDKLTKEHIIVTSNGEKTKINKIIKYTGTKKICNINNIELTHGHPVKLDDKWIKPRDYFHSQTKTLDLMNLILDDYHEVVISNGTDQLTIATLNKFEWIG